MNNINVDNKSLAPKYREAMTQLTEMIDRHYAELIIDLAASVASGSACPEIMKELAKLRRHVEDIFETGLKLDLLKGAHAHVVRPSGSDDLSFGRVRR